jgi:hypothetical protein
MANLPGLQLMGQPCAGANVRDALASPQHADFRGMPPLYFLVGTREMLRDDCRPFHERRRGEVADLDQVSSHRIRRDPDPAPGLAERAALGSEPSDLLDVVSRERPAHAAAVERGVELDDPEDRVGHDGQPSLRRPHPLLPPPERPLVDPDEPGELLPGEPLRLAGDTQPLAQRPPRRVGAVPEEGYNLGEEPDLWFGAALLPTIDRGLADSLCNGKILLPEAPQDALPAEVFAPGLRVTWIGEMFGFSRS